MSGNFDPSFSRKTNHTLRRSARKRLMLAVGRCVVEDLEGRRLLSAGDLDPTFGGDGRVTTNIAGGDIASGESLVAVQSDGKIIAVGRQLTFSGGFGGGPFAIARYNTDGSLDSSFAGDGCSGRQTTRCLNLPAAAGTSPTPAPAAIIPRIISR